MNGKHFGCQPQGQIYFPKYTGKDGSGNLMLWGYLVWHEGGLILFSCRWYQDQSGSCRHLTQHNVTMNSREYTTETALSAI